MKSIFFLISVLSVLASAMSALAGDNNSATLDLTISQPPVLRDHLKWGGTTPAGEALTVTSQSLERNGRPLILTMGEVHPDRVRVDDWEDILLKMKAGGINTVSCYLFWNTHEPDPGVFDFTGSREVRRFFQLCAKHGLWVWPRIGPFCNAEMIHGGLPSWLYGMPVVERSNDPNYLALVERWYRKLGEQFKGLLYQDGGPIVGVQLENEYQHAPHTWDSFYQYGCPLVSTGSDGESHMIKLKELACQAGITPPIFSCTAWNSPVPIDEFLPMFGGYTFLGSGGPTEVSTFSAHRTDKRHPYAFCELGGGTPAQRNWRPIVPPESVEVSLFTRVACGGNITGIYMYHGGSNPVGPHGFMNGGAGMPIISYDFSAPIREYGQIAESYRHARRIHWFLQDFADQLAPTAPIWPEHHVKAANSTDLRYMARARNDRGFLFLNNYQDKLALPDRNGVQVTLKTGHGPLVIPERGGILLKSGVMAILPFNLDLGGAELCYATAQPLMKLDLGGKRTLVFFAPDGMATEYVFGEAGVRTVRGLEPSAQTREGGKLHVAISQPGSKALFTVTPKSGAPFNVLTLTHEQARHSLKARLWGAPRLVISGQEILACSEALRVYAIGENRLAFSVYPAPLVTLMGPKGALSHVEDGVFCRYELEAPPCSPSLAVRKLGEDRVVLNLPQGAFDGVSDLFLRVGYYGDLARIFSGGALVADNFNNGQVWEVGLKRFREALKGEGLFIRLSPWRDRAEKVIFDGITFKPVEPSTGPKAYFKDIAVIPEYSAEVRVEQTAVQTSSKK